MLNQQQIDDILEMQESGMEIKGIAGELGISVQVVRNTLNEAGRPTTKKRDEARDAEIVADYQNNLVVSEILAKYTISHAQMYYILNLHSVPIRRVTEASEREHALNAAVDLYVQGAPLWRIKEETGVAQPTLHAALHTRDIKLRNTRKESK